jgi:hypothetical protein
MGKTSDENQAFFLFMNRYLFFVHTISFFDGRLSNTTSESDVFFSSLRVFCIWKDYLFSVRKRKGDVKNDR